MKQSANYALVAKTVHSQPGLAELERWFGNCPFAVVALSGGVDSSLVSFLANRFLGQDRNLSVISDSPSLKRGDLEAASAFCLRHQIPLRVIRTTELEDPNYFRNPVNRCFHCKHTLYEEMQAVAAATPGSWTLNGTNLDDLGDYRPGLEAAGQFRVCSPLAECGLTKEAVRELAASLGLDCWDKPASPCLSSRIPYGQPVTRQKLRQIEEAESILQGAGFPVVRFRHYGSEGRIEVPARDLPRLKERFESLGRSLRGLGFVQIVVDEEGFESGKLNRAIGKADAEARG